MIGFNWVRRLIGAAGRADLRQAQDEISRLYDRVRRLEEFTQKVNHRTLMVIETDRKSPHGTMVYADVAVKEVVFAIQKHLGVKVMQQQIPAETAFVVVEVAPAGGGSKPDSKPDVRRWHEVQPGIDR